MLTVSAGLLVAAGFLSLVAGMARGFRNVTDVYGWRLRNGLVLLGLVSLVLLLLLLCPSVVDTFASLIFLYFLVVIIKYVGL